jgi:MFS superfamily sulfate permease-like transporter
MLRYDFEVVAFMWKANKMDFLIWCVSFLLTLFMGMQVGIITAILLSMVSLLFRMSRMPMEELLRHKVSTDAIELF